MGKIIIPLLIISTFWFLVMFLYSYIIFKLMSLKTIFNILVGLVTLIIIITLFLKKYRKMKILNQRKIVYKSIIKPILIFLILSVSTLIIIYIFITLDLII
ncbi:MAG: hypothetical protein N2712_04315 [Brevinematales bacterium]|nr:hypothetical protein [Brevinematales bacterium]